ncbi:MAG: DNA polymerase III subunit alpha [Gammaproteobacteria bacterium]
MSEAFVHLRLHTEYSLVDGVVRIAPLMERAVELGMPAVAMTDAGNLFALVKFYRAAEAHGIKPIIGADLQLALDDGEAAGVVTALVCGSRGYRRLCELITRSYIEGQHAGHPELRASWFGDGAEELIVLAGRESPVGHAFAAGNAVLAGERLALLGRLFPHGVYLELTRTDRPGEEAYNQAAVHLAVASGCAAVATNDVRFLVPQDYVAHEARVAIHQGYRLTDTGRESRYSREQYLKSAEEMAERFADLPEALAASTAIAERASFALDLDHPVLPTFPTPEKEDENSYLKRQAEAGLADRLGAPAFKLAAPVAKYRERLAEELGVILETGFAGYFLIVADFISWARANAVPVGPGRGSGAGSLVAYALGITDLDPLAYDLLFERFLNPERVSMPDFDVDFCMEGRDRVIEYVAERYGRDHVSQIITYGSMAARAVVRDVGRVLGHPYGFVDKIAKMVPFEIGMTLDKALQDSPELKQAYKGEEEVRSLIDLARKLEGLARNAGKHAGGVVIAPQALTEFTPLYAEANGASPVTQLDKDDVEAVGLVKFDFLGLRTLTIIDKAVKLINAGIPEGEPPVAMSDLPLNDTATYELLKRGETTAVFQLESRGMKELIQRLKPDGFEDIIAINALFRPGPLQSGMVDDFIARKHGEQKVVYPHPALETILKPTYGVILYQEQVMQIGQVLAGYTLGAADLLRRAMGKKKPEEMARQREVFLEGAVARGVDARVAKPIFDLMEKFAGYGFNKSHSAAYALLGYQTAWLKTHYPAAFMAAVLSADMDHTEKIVRFIDECRHMDLEILPPHVNHSMHAFAVEGDRAIRYGLGAIKGLGRGAAEALVAERERGGAFKDLADLCVRADPGRLNRRAFEALIEAGALDGFGKHRAALAVQLPLALAASEQRQRAGLAGQDDFFGLVKPPPVAMVDAAEWDEHERLAREKRTLGLYLSGHPMRRYAALVPRLGAEPISELMGDAPASGGAAARPVRVAGLVVELRRFGRRTAVTLDDESGRIEAMFFDDVAERSRKLLVPDRIVVLDGRLVWDDYFNRWRITADEIADIETVAEREAGCLWIELRPNGEEPDACIARLKEALSAHRGGNARIALRYHGALAGACLKLGDDWRVAARKDLIAGIESLAGVERVEITYKRQPVAHRHG